MITFLIALFLFVPSAHAASETCAFETIFVNRSGQLPYAGTLEQQKDAIEQNEKNDNGTKRTMRFIHTRVGGLPAYRFIFQSSEGIVENILYNKAGHSYQLTLVSNRQTYRRALKDVRKLLAHPYDNNATLCGK